jgi:hypothetical protein
MKDDPYLEMVYEHWEDILRWYNLFADKGPVMLFDVQEQRIYAYPYKEFKEDMNQRSRAILQDQYRRARHNNQMVVFVRDNDKEKLVSYSLELA